MISLDDYQALKRKVETIRRDKDKARGALDQVMSDIKEEFGVKTIKEAKLLLTKLELDRQMAADKYLAKKKKFEEKWKDVLEAMDNE